MLLDATSVSTFTVPEILALTFEGFTEEAFAILDRLKAEPHIGQYRLEKDSIKEHLTTPFKRYRDDLVVNGVLPNRLNWETERNVFSRLLKNDFGAGGCHHHLWLSMYRPERKRLRDYQLSHSLSPKGLNFGFYVGDYATDLIRRTRETIIDQPEAMRVLMNDVLADPSWTLGIGTKRERYEVSGVLNAWPDDIEQMQWLWVRTLLPREEVLRLRGDLVGWALARLQHVWPWYHRLL
ncbi:MAG: hypothetical protein RhofKO_38010 [Rhodothermales bacterium]